MADTPVCPINSQTRILFPINGSQWLPHSVDVDTNGRPATNLPDGPFVLIRSSESADVLLARELRYASIVERLSERNPHTVAPIAATFVILAPVIASGPMAALKPTIIVEAHTQTRCIVIALVRVPALAPAIANLIG